MKPIKILLVDDDEDDFILTQDILRENPRSKNYELTWCDNYSDAINAMLKRRYDIYLVDYRLGKYSGIDLLHEAIRSNCLQPIIILTGKGDLKIDEEALRIGAADYLVKGEIDSFSLERSIRYAIEHHKALEALKASENKFRIIFERSKDPMLITDFEGTIYDANQAAAAFFETTHEELLKQNDRSLYISSLDRELFISQIEDKGSVAELEIDFKTAGGRIKTCSVSSFKQISQDGANESYHTIIHDLTYRKRQEQELLHLQKAAAFERIAKNIAFEIRNPLSNVNLALDELAICLKNQEESLLLDIVKTNTSRIAQLVTEFIASTQPTNLDIKTISASDLINGMISDVENSFSLSPDVEIPDEAVWLRADEEKLRAAFLKVIANAVEAEQDLAALPVFQISKTNGFLNIIIKDSGKGISQENLNKVFEPFFTTKPLNAGLGLTYARQIINGHNGQISIDSSEIGTSVTISLPLTEM